MPGADMVRTFQIRRRKPSVSYLTLFSMFDWGEGVYYASYGVKKKPCSSACCASRASRYYMHRTYPDGNEQDVLEDFRVPVKCLCGSA